MSSDSSPRVSRQRRKFTVQSEFGNARQWRSRKNRPCDICRKRKTVCVITSVPPCLFCKGRGLECTSSTPIDQTSDAAVGGRNHVHTTAGPSQPEFGHRQRPNSPGPAATPSAVEGPGPNTDGLWTLEDNANRTAHSMGPAAEQDTHVLDAIRSSVLSSADEVDADMIQVYGGSKYLWDPPVHFCLLQDEFAAHDNAARDAASSAIEGLVGQYGPILVRLYFKHIHPVLPVLSKVRFLRQYAVDKTKLPASLRGAVYALASVFDKKDPSLKGPFPFKQHQLADYATDSLQRELDSPNLAKLQASLLLLHVKPNDVDSIEHPRTWTSTAQAVATAQMIGLHQDAERWSIAPWEKSLRRKLWWATYVADVWSAVCHGNPPHIYPASFNTSDITMDDLRSDEEVPPELEAMIDPVSSGFQIATGARFLELVKVENEDEERMQLRDSSQVPRLRPPGPGEDGNTGRLLLLRDKLGDWDGLLPRCLAMPSPAEALGPSNNAPLHLAYYAYLVLLYRALMTPATKEAKMDSSSNLHRWFETAVRDFEGFLGLIEAVTPEDLQGFWGRHARSQLILCGNFLIYLFLLSPTNSDVDAVWGLIERFEASLQRLESQADEAAKLLIHPVALRVQSLFIQGVDLMRKSHSAGTASATASAV